MDAVDWAEAVHNHARGSVGAVDRRDEDHITFVALHIFEVLHEERFNRCSLPKLTALTTSAVPAQRAIRAGRRSNIPFHSRRASSYPSAPGRSNPPRRPALNSSTTASAMRGPVAVETPPSVIVAPPTLRRRVGGSIALPHERGAERRLS